MPTKSNPTTLPSAVSSQELQPCCDIPQQSGRHCSVARKSYSWFQSSVQVPRAGKREVFYSLSSAKNPAAGRKPTRSRAISNRPPPAKRLTRLGQH
eukprot:7258238-Prorocentrum_lima.AAC.1